MSDTKTAFELERLRVNALAERIGEEERRERRAIESNLAGRGLLNSGQRGGALVELKMSKLRELIAGKIEIRKSLASGNPDLCTEGAMSSLLAALNNTINLGFAGLRDHLAHVGAAAGSTVGISGAFDGEITQLQAEAHRSVEIMRRELLLGRGSPMPTAATHVIHTGGGPAIVNLGTIHGNVQQVIGTLNAAGEGELASQLERLAAAIESAADSAEDRAAFLEQVRLIAEQASAEPSERNPSLVRGALLGIRGALQHSANVAQIISVAGPAIAHHFGFHWPG